MQHINEFLDYVKGSEWLIDAIGASEKLGIPNYYVAGGAVTQVVWNQLSGAPIHSSIKDVDVVYFEPGTDDLEQEKLQKEVSRAVGGRFAVDVTNQALVHTWYAEKFGNQIAPYRRTEDGIDTWLSAFAVGIRAGNDEMVVYAPYGLEDLLSMTIRPNPRQITKEIFARMVSSYKQRWPAISVEDWHG